MKENAISLMKVALKGDPREKIVSFDRPSPILWEKWRCIGMKWLDASGFIMDSWKFKLLIQIMYKRQKLLFHLLQAESCWKSSSADLTFLKDCFFYRNVVINGHFVPPCTWSWNLMTQDKTKLQIERNRTNQKWPGNLFTMSELNAVLNTNLSKSHL